MGMGKQKGHLGIIEEAHKLFESSVSMFTEAEKKIDEAQHKLDTTIEGLESAIAHLVELKEKALKDKLRNAGLKEKLQTFTAK